MNKPDVITAIAKKTGLSKVATKKLLNSILTIIGETIANGEKVQILRFGTFEKRSRVSKKGHNPRTNEEIIVPPFNTPFFKPGDTLKKVVIIR